MDLVGPMELCLPSLIESKSPEEPKELMSILLSNISLIVELKMLDLVMEVIISPFINSSKKPDSSLMIPVYNMKPVLLNLPKETVKEDLSNSNVTILTPVELVLLSNPTEDSVLKLTLSPTPPSLIMVKLTELLT